MSREKQKQNQRQQNDFTALAKRAVSEVVSENSVVQSLSKFGEESKDLYLVRRIARASHVNILLHIYINQHFE